MPKNQRIQGKRKKPNVPFHIQVCAGRIMQTLHLRFERCVISELAMSTESFALIPSSRDGRGMAGSRFNVIGVEIKLRMRVCAWDLVDSLNTNTLFLGLEV